MSRASNKAERLLQVEALLLAHPEGLTQAQIASELGVHRSTVYRYLPDLTTQFHVYDRGGGRLAIDRTAYLVRLKVSVHEATAIYLAGRLLDRQTDERNPHAASALRKLGAALQPVAAPMARGIVATAERMLAREGRDAPGYLTVLETVTQAWVHGRWLELVYRSRSAHDDAPLRFAPYLLEACGPGYSTYALGMLQPPGEERTLKLERIRSAVLTDAPYVVPDGFDVAGAFDGAWGVWRPSADGPREVVLRFDRRVRARLAESRWHATEVTEPQSDGSVLRRARVGALIEILPWIRSWGPDVEVVAPEELRALVAGQLRAALARYDDV